MYCNLLKKLSFCAVLVFAVPVFGHGAQVTWTMEGDSIHIRALFDDGQPMTGAQVTVFSGAAPSVAYQTGLTDDEGTFAFLPDAEQSTDWDVQVRKAGHGDIIHFSLTEESDTTPQKKGFSILQIILMSLCVVWGFIGTALFFASKRKISNAHS